MNKTLLFEIGTEELPANYMEAILENVKSLAEEKLNANRIGYVSLSTLGTPRRIALIVEGISDKQSDLDEVIKGPTKQLFYNEQGELTKAAQGFLRKYEMEESSVYTDKVNHVEYIFARRLQRGQETKEVLKTILPEMITQIKTPKTMKWRDYDLRFARPIRWLVALLGDEQIDFGIEGVSVGKETRGHRTLSDQKIVIKHADDYVELMRSNCVIVNPEERRESIRNQIKELASTKDGVVVVDEDLLTEVTYLVEYPTALMGNFETEFLELPKEVVVTPMKEHQRYFPVESVDGKLLPYFIAVRNGGAEHLDIVRVGNEKVLRARLKDAQFFYREDLKEPLESRVGKLQMIVYQEKLGTMYDKVMRIGKLAGWIGGSLGLSQERMKKLERAAYLCKADMMTNLVNEFDELQGVMGKYYALCDQEDIEVAEAIRSYYLPRFSGDDLPSDTLGQIISIADKLDSVVSSFAIGASSTVSNDPYGLRRQTLGIIHIILSSELDIRLDEMIEYSMTLVEDKLEVTRDTLKDTIHSFIKQRLRVNLIERGYRYDIVDAVLEGKMVNLIDILEKIKVIATMMEERKGFAEIMKVANRVQNMITGTSMTEVDVSLFESNLEQNLHKSLTEVREEFAEVMRNRQYQDALEILYTLLNPINEFLDQVLIRVENEAIRNNRLAMLNNVSSLFAAICDFSKIGKE